MMYAIVKIAGKQFKVTKDQELYVPKLEERVGAQLTFDKVLLFAEADQPARVGTPCLTGMKVMAKVVDHQKDAKVIVFKKKRRKGYKKKQGHRQDYTKICIEDILK